MFRLLHFCLFVCWSVSFVPVFVPDQLFSHHSLWTTRSSSKSATWSSTTANRPTSRKSNGRWWTARTARSGSRTQSAASPKATYRTGWCWRPCRPPTTTPPSTTRSTRSPSTWRTPTRSTAAPPPPRTAAPPPPRTAAPARLTSSPTCSRTTLPKWCRYVLCRVVLCCA